MFKFALHFWMAPRVGFEPTTYRLTADCSAAELPRNDVIKMLKNLNSPGRIFPQGCLR